LNLLVKEGTLAYDQFLCPATDTQSATRGDGDNREWGFRMYEGGDSSNDAYYAIDYAYHLGGPRVNGRKNPAAFGELPGGVVIAADRCASGDGRIDDDWNHGDDGVNVLTNSHSVNWIPADDEDRIVVSEDNPYTAGGSGGSPAGRGGTVGGTPRHARDSVLYHPVK
ncbi:MAG: hypothetical protein ACOC8F_06755, partial [Planctomycetota bacterium]